MMESGLFEDGAPDFDFFHRSAKITDTELEHVLEPIETASTVSTDENANKTYRVRLDHFSRDVLLEREPLAGTGGLIWPAGEFLASYLCQVSEETQELRDKTIVELGSGTGIVGLSVALNANLGSGVMYLTDLPQVIPLLKRNVALNGHPTGVQIAEFTWGHDLSDHLKSLTIDVVLMADCIYLESQFQPLIDTLLQVMPANAKGFLCYKKRRKADARFFKLLKKHFRCEPVTPRDDIKVAHGLHLYVLYKRRDR